MSIDELGDTDDLALIGLEPQTWHRFVQLQIGLLRNHVQGLEKQIDESVKAYEMESVVTDVEHDSDGYPHIILEEHRGIEAPPNHLADIFEYYFPNLHRRGELIVLFSFLEHQLDQLCELFAVEQHLKIVHTDLRDTGVDRSRRYLRKVMDLPLDENSSCWQEIKKIQKVRNVVAHNDGKLGEKADSTVVTYVTQAKYLSLASESNYYYGEKDEVNILGGYLTYVLDTFDSYCSEINMAIKARYGS